MSVQKYSLNPDSNVTIGSDINIGEGCSPATINDAIRTLMSDLAAYVTDQAGQIVTGGTGSAYTATTNSGWTSYSDALHIRVKVHETCSNSATISIDGLAPKPIYRAKDGGLAAVGAGDLVAGQVVGLRYDSSTDGFVIIGPAPDVSLVNTAGAALITAQAAQEEAVNASISADQAASVAAQIAALGSLGVYPDTATAQANTSNGDYYVVANSAGSVLAVYQNTATGPLLIAHYPAAERLPGHVASIAIARASDTIISVDGQGTIVSRNGDVIRSLPWRYQPGSTLDPLYERLIPTPDRLYRAIGPGEGRIGYIAGRWTIIPEVSATAAWCPATSPGLGPEWTVSTNATVTQSAYEAVKGYPGGDVTAAVGGNLDYGIGLNNVDFVGDVQIDIIFRPAVATNVLIRLPNGVSPTPLGGGGYVINVDPVTGEFVTNDPTLSASDPVSTPLGNGFWHVRFNFRSETDLYGQTLNIYPKVDASTGRNTTANAGDLLFTLGLVSVQRTNGIRLPVAPGVMGSALSAENLTAPVQERLDPSNITFGAEFYPRPGETKNIVPFKISDASNSNIGLSIECDVGASQVTAVAAGAGGTVTVSVPVYTYPVRAMASIKNGRFRLTANGMDAETPIDIDAIALNGAALTNVYAGHGGSLYASTSRGYPFVISGWAAGGELADGSYYGGADRNILPTPVVGDRHGTGVIFADDMSEAYMPIGHRMLEEVGFSRRIAEIAGIPDVKIFTGDAPYYYALTQTESPAPVMVRYDLDQGIHYAWTQRGMKVIWGGGQSLMYAFTYGNPINWPDTPLFRDLQDGLYNSIFGNSTAGYYTDLLQVPTISQDPNGGPGGVMYPTIHRYVRESVPPALTIAKSIGKSGEQIRFLWKWGIYDEAGNPLVSDTIWQNILRWHQSVADAAARIGIKPYCPFFVWVHGTADASNTTYADDLDRSRADLRDLVYTYFGQETDPVWVMTQSGGRADTSNSIWPVCEQELDWATRNAGNGVVLAGPLYPGEYTLAENNVHPDYESTTLIGELIGIAMAETEKGNKWTIGRPDIILTGTTIKIDFSRWLRPDERLFLAPDTYYGGVGIDNYGFELVQIEDPYTTGVTRYGAPAATILSVSISDDGQSYIIELDAAPTGTHGWALLYAEQRQDMTTVSPNHYARRGLCRTTWERSSMVLPGRKIYRWIPSFAHEVIA